MINFLAILELCTFYIEYKNVKFTANNFSGRTIFKYFRQAHLLRYCKDTAKVPSLPLLEITTKSTHIFSCKERDTNSVYRPSKNKQKVLNYVSKHQAWKIRKPQRLFLKIWINKQHNYLGYFLLHSSFLSISLHKSMHKERSFPSRILK